MRKPFSEETSFERVILGTITEGITAMDPLGRVFYANLAAARLLGFANPEEVIGLDPAERFEDWRCTRESGEPYALPELPTRRALTSARQVSDVVVYRRQSDGAPVHVLVTSTPILGEDGQLRVLVNNFRDISEQAAAARRTAFLGRASDLLGRSLDYERTLQQVVRAAVPDIADWCAVDMLDAEGRPRMVAIHHREPVKVELARRLRETYPLPRAGEKSVVVEVIATGRSSLLPEISDEVLVAAARDDEHLGILRALGLRTAMVAPLRVPHRRHGPMGAITFVREVGPAYTNDDLALAECLGNRAAIAIENARLYAVEREARAEALVAQRRKDDFLAALGHELRNPLAPIVSALELLELEGGDALETPRQVIRRQVRHLEHLIEDLHDLSRIGRGKIELACDSVEMAEIANAGLERCHRAIADREHTLSVDVPKGLVVRGDGIRLSQVVTNLVSNAARYTPPGGRIEVRGWREGGLIRLSVTDDGAGFDEDLAESLFEPFVQGNTGSERGGLGLGLAIVKRLVDLHGGTITARSSGPGSGSTFEVSLPETCGEAADGAPAHVSDRDTGPAVASRRVLIVDDEEDTADLLAMGLERAGHVTRVAGDGLTALRVLGEFVPHVALVDIGLPTMDGYELARRIREAGFDDIRLVAVTGYGREEDRERAFDVGFQDYLVKPISLKDLCASLRDRVEHRSEGGRR